MFATCAHQHTTYYTCSWVLVSSLGFVLSVGLWCNSLLLRATAQPADPYDADFEGFDAWHMEQAPHSLTDRVVAAVNCGGPQHTDVFGITYAADPLPIGISSDFGRRYIIQRVPKNDQILYQTERYNLDSFTYEVDLPRDGSYVLVMKFSEVYFQESNRKIFSIVINSEPLVSDLDIFAAVGHGVAHDVIVPVQLNKGTLNVVAMGTRQSLDAPDNKLSITFAKGPADNPKVNAFYVLSGGLDEKVPRLPPLEEYRRRLEEQQQQEVNSRRQDPEPGFVSAPS